MNPSIPFLNASAAADDFDWDAAVKEIDAACQSSSANVFQTPPPLPPQQLPPFKNAHLNLFNKPLPNNSRQLTIDSFVSNGAASCSRIGGKVCEIGEEGDARVSERACYVDIDIDAAKTWIYPDNVPRREYQLAITKTALFSNTLVALPTGLGKTLIAAAVMYNYFRWFPEGKIVFAAPSRPLVMQQIEACHNIVGIPQEWTTDMTGLTSPPKRAALWRSKRVFFLTPQVLEKDIQSGACLVKYIVCLVIDEAHRAMGNYSYCVAVRELMAVPVELRILALTATPGSKQQTIQQVIDNLQISTLEYRSESDVDVCPYVHNRKIELMEVPMGKDAIKVNNLILDAIQPLVNKLSAMGVLQGRDIQTFSPCDLLNSREKFRQAPPQELSSVKYSEVEGFFGVLITLYHIRKLLSSHGIRPAHEMLEEKLRQGYFARLMTRNEAIQQAKDLMQKSLSHGAPSPKLSKMLEVLVDHFSNHDPGNSRVIIFSNFRGSVRDIMDSLANIGHSVKATQFIGQSSGKTLKGQSQKIQQAVLEKFRMGGYNVIVATSIGEEGLDIMEVDLVICFDANISPLRMIQRMGRTGRKNDGRVVVLACEGTELKGYKRKQATGKTVRKHMQNGGSNSFNFHCSPRMVPHLLKPELQFVELSIEKFVRHFNKGKVDSRQAPKLREKLSDAEAALLNNYFLLNKDVCKPSLVAFPHFQAFPSRVHAVKHSPRTGWLIDAMQHLQGLSSSTTCKTFDVDISGGRCLPAGNIEQHNNSMRELHDQVYPIEEEKEMFDLDICSSGTSVDSENEIPDSSGKVSKIVLPLPAITPSKKQKMQDYPIQNEWQVGKSQFPLGSKLPETVVGHEITVHSPPHDDKCLKEITGSETAYETEPMSPEIIAGKFNLDVADSDLSPRLTNFFISGVVPESPLDCTDGNVRSTKKVKDKYHADNQVGEVKSEIVVPEPSLLGRSCVNLFSFTKEDTTSAAAPLKRVILPSTAVDNAHTPPRGPVFDLPLEKIGTSVSRSMENCQTSLQKLTSSSCTEDKDHADYQVGEVKSEIVVPEPSLLGRSCLNSFSFAKEDATSAAAPLKRVILPSTVVDNAHTPPRGPVVDLPLETIGTSVSRSMENCQTPLQKLTGSSCTEDWRMSSGEKSVASDQPFRLRRLRKIGDLAKGRLQHSTQKKSTSTMKLPFKPPRNVIRHARAKKPFEDARDFIDEEAEVSAEDLQDSEVVPDSEDEDSDAYEDSFIDDQADATAGSSQAEDSKFDMMAIYRRSLLTQSPFQEPQEHSAAITPLSVPSVVMIMENKECPDTHKVYSKSSSISARISGRSHLNPIACEAIPNDSSGSQVNEAYVDNRKRKSNSDRVFTVPAKNLEKEFNSNSGQTGKQVPLSDQANGTGASCSTLWDDPFYEDLDLDELEAQATRLLSQRRGHSLEGGTISEPPAQSITLPDAPSFDLGIL